MAEKSMDSAEVLTSPLLTRCGFRHAFFARRGGASTGAYSSLNFSIAVGDSETNVAENVARAAAALGVSAERVYYLSQVHGRVAVSLRGDEDRSEVVTREGDAVSSRNEHCAIGVRIADCVPILVGDTETGAVAAVHAGWRGIVAGVVEAGVDAIRGAAGSAAGLVAAIGPHISVAAFEVSEDVADTLRACSPDPGVVDRSYGTKPHVDLSRIAIAKLEALGVPRGSIDRVGGCTYLEPERYFSFRRDGPRSGRHLAAIVAR
jgi:YfiH family protein